MEKDMERLLKSERKNRKRLIAAVQEGIERVTLGNVNTHNLRATERISTRTDLEKGLVIMQGRNEAKQGTKR